MKENESPRTWKLLAACLLAGMAGGLLGATRGLSADGEIELRWIREASLFEGVHVGGVLGIAIGLAVARLMPDRQEWRGLRPAMVMVLSALLAALLVSDRLFFVLQHFRLA